MHCYGTTKLVRFYQGVDGLKTGYTNESGYCLTATAKKNNMRIIAVIMGSPDSKLRNQEISEMLDYSYAQYGLEHILSTTSNLGLKEVEKGKQKYTEIVATTDVTSLYKKVEQKKNYTYNIKVNPIKAPVKKGDIVGTLDIMEGNTIVRTIDLTVKEDIKKANIFELYIRYLKETISGDIKIK